jgi:hypothetical protein
MKKESMRKQGENSVKRAGRAAIPPTEYNDFTPWYRKSNYSLVTQVMRP